MVHETNHGTRIESSPLAGEDAQRQRSPRTIQPHHPGRVREPAAEKFPHLAKRDSRVPRAVQPKKAAPGAWPQNTDSKDRRNSYSRFQAIDLKTTTNHPLCASGKLKLKVE